MIFACDETSDAASRECGRLSQGIPPSTDCIDAYMEAFLCAGNAATCAVYEESLIDDFEDDDTVSGRQGFSSWGVQGDGDPATTISPVSFVPGAHGMVVDLTPTWRRYTVRFDDPNFTQDGFGETTVFNPAQVEGLIFSTWGRTVRLLD